jgi:mycoredoxin
VSFCAASSASGAPEFHPPRVSLSYMQLLVYTSQWCRDCRAAKRFLDEHRIDYTEIDIESTPSAAAELLKNVGKRAIPQFVLDGKWVQPYKPGRGFLYEEMSALFGVVGAAD